MLAEWWILLLLTRRHFGQMSPTEQVQQHGLRGHKNVLHDPFWEMGRKGHYPVNNWLFIPVKASTEASSLLCSVSSLVNCVLLQMDTHIWCIPTTPLSPSLVSLPLLPATSPLSFPHFQAVDLLVPPKDLTRAVYMTLSWGLTLRSRWTRLVFLPPSGLCAALLGPYIGGTIRVSISRDFFEDEVDYFTYLDNTFPENCPRQWNVNLKMGHGQTLVGQKCRDLTRESGALCATCFLDHLVW